MYVAVRRYEGVTDPQKVGQLVDEGFLPIISEIVAEYLAPLLPNPAQFSADEVVAYKAK
jgi:hypothetical protein